MGLFSKLFGRGSADDDSSAEVEALIAKLDDPEVKVRLEAAIALGEMGSKAHAAVSKLEELINDTDGDVCNAAADAYSKIERGF
jgi:HEAT repeat protein